MKILLVDDDKALITVFEEALKKGGFEVITAENGNSALEKAKVEKPSMILLDQILPDIAGNEVLKTLKSQPETQNIPVAILSNFGQKELIDEAIKLGALDYILKYQIDTSELVEKIKGLVKESGGQNAAN